MRHGDKKTEFATGAQRDTDEGKGNPSLISPVLIHRLGVLLEKGAKHYGADNWMKGMPYRRTADSIIRHIWQWLAGDEEEDHLAAVCFGAMCLMTYESDKVLDQKLDDRDEGLKKILASILTSVPTDATLKSKASTESRVYKCRGCGRMAYVLHPEEWTCGHRDCGRVNSPPDSCCYCGKTTTALEVGTCNPCYRKYVGPGRG